MEFDYLLSVSSSYGAVAYRIIMKIFVVTNPELGWDCVIGAYQANNPDEVEKYIVVNEREMD